MPAGRPTEYRSEFADKAKEMCIGGAIDAELAEEFGVSVTTIYNWRHKYPEFLDAVKGGAKDIADERVIQTLYSKALSGDVTACIFWLKNRKSKEWRDKHELTGADDGPVQFTVKHIGGSKDAGI